MNVKKPPTYDKTENSRNFLGIYLGVEKDHYENAQWLKREEKRCKGLEGQIWEEIMVENLKKPSEITEMEITRNRKSSQLLVEQF